MLFLFDRYGIDFMSALHRDGDAQGLAGVQDQLDAFATGTDVYDVVHDFQTMNLVDRCARSRQGQGQARRLPGQQGHHRRASTPR